MTHIYVRSISALVKAEGTPVHKSLAYANLHAHHADYTPIANSHTQIQYDPIRNPNNQTEYPNSISRPNTPDLVFE